MSLLRRRSWLRGRTEGGRGGEEEGRVVAEDARLGAGEGVGGRGGGREDRKGKAVLHHLVRVHPGHQRREALTLKSSC